MKTECEICGYCSATHYNESDGQGEYTCCGCQDCGGVGCAEATIVNVLTGERWTTRAH